MKPDPVSVVDALVRATAATALLAGWSRKDLNGRLNAAFLSAREDLGLSGEQMAGRLGLTTRTTRGWAATISRKASSYGLEIILRLLGADVPGRGGESAALHAALRDLLACPSLLRQDDENLAVSPAVVQTLDRHADALAEVAQHLKNRKPGVNISTPGFGETADSRALDKSM